MAMALKTADENPSLMRTAGCSKDSLFTLTQIKAALDASLHPLKMPVCTEN